MKVDDYIFTSESVTEGHPDKMADQISDAILDYIIKRDENARVACEVMLSNGYCIIAGEIKTTAYAPMAEIARGVIQEIGYTDAAYGFDYRSAGILNSVGEQSPEIGRGVDRDDGDIGAGDQGVMFGYACKQTDVLMPLPIYYAHKLTQALADARKSALLPFLRPDGKAQVSVQYINGKPSYIDTIVLSAQHHSDVKHSDLEESIMQEIIKANIPSDLLRDNSKYYINPTGKFVIGGPKGDAGLTGRKIIVDTYGGSAPHGGGAFSGKDPTKVDRSGAYAARYIAKNLVASGICDEATVQLSYAIGIVDPISIHVNTHNSARVDESKIIDCVKNIFELTPKGIINSLNLIQPIYKKSAAYGHFGRELNEFKWEQIDKVNEIKSYFNLK